MILLPFSAKAVDEPLLQNGKTDLARKHMLQCQVDDKARKKKKASHVNKVKDSEINGMAPTKPSSIVQSIHQGSILRLRGLIDANALEKLRARKYKSIFLAGAYGKDKSSYAFHDYHLRISPSVINPDVEVLNLYCCRLPGKNIEEIDSFKNLRELYLPSNPIDDEDIRKITKLEKLECLDLSLTNITN